MVVTRNTASTTTKALPRRDPLGSASLASTQRVYSLMLLALAGCGSPPDVAPRKAGGRSGEAGLERSLVPGKASNYLERLGLPPTRTTLGATDVRGLRTRVGVLVRVGEGDVAKDCLKCSQGMCEIDTTLCHTLGQRKNLCPGGDGAAYTNANLPSLTSGACTVTAVGNNSVMTVPHCVPDTLACGDESEKPYKVLFGYTADRWGAKFESYDVVVAGGRPFGPVDCKNKGILAGDVPEEDVPVNCLDVPERGEDSSLEGIVFLRLDRAHHRRKNLGEALACSAKGSTQDGRTLRAYSHPYGGPLVETRGPALPSNPISGALRTRMLLEVGSSGSPLFEQNGDLVGVVANGARMAYCFDLDETRSRPYCNDKMTCLDVGCDVAVAEPLPEKLCKALAEVDL